MTTLEEAKQHLRVDTDDDDTLIASLLDAAEETVLNHLNLEALPDAEPVRVAILMLLGALYENRESVVDRPLSENPLFARLLAPYREMAA